jgi:hypothetical protein
MQRKMNAWFLTGAAAVLTLAVGCSGPAAPVAPVAAMPDFKATLTIQDIMESIVDPSADFLWGTVSTEVGPKGVVEKAPQTEAEWREVRRNAVLLMESSNLLKIPGRGVARPGTKSTAPGIEEEPEGTKKLMDADRASWNKAADELYEAAALLLKAAQDRNPEAILDSGNKLDEACESCHLKYWYPKQTEILKQNAAAQEPAKK